MHTLSAHAAVPRTWEELLTLQEEREASATAAGAARFRADLDRAVEQGQASTTGAAHKLLAHSLDSLTAALQDALDHPRVNNARIPKGSPSTTLDRRRKQSKPTAPKYHHWVEMAGPDVTAYLALKVLLDELAGGQAIPPATLADTIVGYLLDELRYRRIKALAPSQFRYHMASVRGRSDRRHHARLAEKLIESERIDCSDLALSQKDRVTAGFGILDVALESLGWFDFSREPVKGKRRLRVVIRLRKEILDSLAVHNDALALLRPLHTPMVVPPLPWSPGIRGGYRFAIRDRHPLVTGASRENQRRIALAQMPSVYAAINAIQETPWRINTALLGVVKEILALGGGFAGLPCSSDTPLPQRPTTPSSPEDADQQWRRNTADIHRANALRLAEWRKVLDTLAVAEPLASVDAFYFPHHLDFRGRVYPTAAHLSPQGSDLSRALLRFADAKLLDENSARWLALHGASLLGRSVDGRRVSEMTLDERIALIEADTDLIRQAAKDPVGIPGYWMRADKPLSFLAFCIEWAGWLDAREAGEEYHSSLPCHMDGSCNGLQHFSALFSDEVGGREVNLTPSSRPHDIYQTVAVHVRESLASRAAQEPLVATWRVLDQKLSLIDRKLTKRPTMTFGYGAKQFGFAQALRDDLWNREDSAAIASAFIREGQEPWEAISHASTCMAGLIWNAIESTVVAAFDGMAWMQAVARRIAGSGKEVEWVVPTGFPIRQAYREMKTAQVQTILHGRTYNFRILDNAQSVDRRKQAAGLAPNVIHSLDAAALTMTVAAAIEEGLDAFAMVHDSYGTHAADCPKLARILREQFVRLYTENDIADSLFQQWRAQCDKPAQCPPPPAKGTLDLTQVLHSPYFFC